MIPLKSILSTSSVILLSGGVITLCLLLGCSGIRPPRGVEPTQRILICTGYCNCQTCCGWERSWLRLGTPVYSYGPLKGTRKIVGQTASGRQARYGTAAVDKRYFPFGTVFKIPGYGYAQAEDVGGAIKGDHIDLWFPSHEAARQWGKRKLRVTIWK